MRFISVPATSPPSCQARAKRGSLVRLAMYRTMSALLGALPLLVATGTGAELRRPLGMTIIGGLAVSQILTLYTTPVVYLYLDRARHWRQRRKAARGVL